MESNPQIMMELMPPTPGRKQNSSALLSEQQNTNQFDESQKKIRPSTSYMGLQSGPRNNFQSSGLSGVLDQSQSTKSMPIKRAVSQNKSRFITDFKTPQSSNVMQRRMVQQQFSQQMTDFRQFTTKSVKGNYNLTQQVPLRITTDQPIHDTNPSNPHSSNVYLTQDLLNNSNSRVRFQDQQTFETPSQKLNTGLKSHRKSIKPEPVKFDAHNTQQLNYNDGNFYDGQSFQYLENHDNGGVVSNTNLRFTDSLKAEKIQNQGAQTTYQAVKSSQQSSTDIMQSNTFAQEQIAPFQQGILLNNTQSPQNNLQNRAMSAKNLFQKQKQRSSLNIYQSQHPGRTMSRGRISTATGSRGQPMRNSMNLKSQGFQLNQNPLLQNRRSMQAKQFVDMAINNMEENAIEDPVYHLENFKNDQRLKQWPIMPKNQSISLLNKGINPNSNDVQDLQEYNGFIDRGKPVDELINSNFRGHRLAKLMGIDNNSIAQKKLQQAKLEQAKMILQSQKKQKEKVLKKKRSPSPKKRDKTASRSPKRSKEKKHESRVKKLKMLRSKIRSKETVRSGGKISKKKKSLAQFEIVNQASVLDQTDRINIESGPNSPACSVCRQIRQNELLGMNNGVASQQTLGVKQNQDLEEMKFNSDQIVIQRPISAAVPELNRKKMPKKIHRETSAKTKIKSAHIDSKAVMGETGKHFGDSDLEKYQQGTSHTNTNQMKNTKIREKQQTLFSHESIPLGEINEMDKDHRGKTENNTQKTEGGSQFSNPELMITSFDQKQDNEDDHHPKCPRSRYSRQNLVSQKSGQDDIEQVSLNKDINSQEQSVQEVYNTLIVPSQNQAIHNIKEQSSKENDLAMDILLGIVDQKQIDQKLKQNSPTNKKLINSVDDLQQLRDQVFNRKQLYYEQDEDDGQDKEDQTPRARYGQFSFDVQSNKFKQESNHSENVNQKQDGPHDWFNTDVYQSCRDAVPRFTKPTFMSDHRAIRIYTYISSMQNNAIGYQQAHILIPMFEYALDFLESLLCMDMGLPNLFDKIKRTHNKINFDNTLKLLKRARIAQQLKDDARNVICRYLDLTSREKMINQLRDENVSDQLIQEQIDKLIKNGVLFMIGTQKFLLDYAKTFKHGKVMINGIDTRPYAEQVLKNHGVLQKDYKEYAFPI